jgi:ABC-type dipeptide/oligopeptide/nickel transport system permease component
MCQKIASSLDGTTSTWGEIIQIQGLSVYALSIDEDFIAIPADSDGKILVTDFSFPTVYATVYLGENLYEIPEGADFNISGSTSKFDITSSILVFTAYAVPAFAIGMLLKTFLCGTVEGLWDIFPLGGTESAEALQNGGLSLFFSRAYHMILPITAYVMTSFALLTIMMKNSLMEQMSSEYVRTVLAKGATRKRAIWGHAFRDALIPIATGFGSVLGVLFAGSMIIETIFEIRGMGLMSLEALQGQDYSIFMAMIVITAGIRLIGNLISDFCYMLIDPRINFD